MSSRSSALLAAAALAFVSSCSSGTSDSKPEARDVHEDVSTPPNISPTAAPGVAFSYDYQFSLPDQRIAVAQEAHAAACEKLGVSRCRITGMSYSVDQKEQVTAKLDLKLDPIIARQFGKSAQQSVIANNGELIRFDIQTSDEGQVIATASLQRTQLSSELARLEQELAKTKAGTAAHTDLLGQIQALRRHVSEQSNAISNSHAVLASTPMKFEYYGRGGVPGFRGNPLRAAWHTLITTVVRLSGFLLQALAVLLPLGLLFALIVALWRTRPIRAVRRWLIGTEHEGYREE